MNESLEEKIESINKIPTWSPVWFKKAARELLGTDKISLNGKLGRDKEFTITVSCNNDEKFNLFKSFIADNTFCFGIPIVINRKYYLQKKKINNPN